MDKHKLRQTARKMVAKGKGILAMDESNPTIAKRFDNVGVANNEENRRAYRSALVTVSGLGEFISGAILFEETLQSDTSFGVSFVSALQEEGIIPGIKVDRGAKELAGFPEEKVTEGLDGLRERLRQYRNMGAQFAKWRAVIVIGDNFPSHACVAANSHGLARYAALCQENDLVPIVEPEVLMDGEHTIERCYEVTREVQQAVFHELLRHGVFLPGIVLKPNMVVAGSTCKEHASTDKVASLTLRCLRDCVPASVPGIAFLSGGLSDADATANLAAVNNLAAEHGGAPWNITFSYGRALQQSALGAWGGKKENEEAAQDALFQRARENGNATIVA